MGLICVMKYTIAAELQKRWIENPPRGWIAAREADLLSKAEREILGYRPLVDLVLTNRDSKKQLWIEIEVSRADPVANHAKFASAHLLRPLNSGDSFISLVSNHISRGRANLAAHTVFLMRTGGIRAFQMPLLAELSANEISGINQGTIPISTLPTPRLEEIIELTSPLTKSDNTEIFYATNVLEVLLNVRQWNLDTLDSGARSAWGRRRVKYLVYDSRSGSFAPAKFCAYTRMIQNYTDSYIKYFQPSMTIFAYSSIPQELGIFDGQKAWKRLSAIGFQMLNYQTAGSEIRESLSTWLSENAELIYFDLVEGSILFEP